MFDLLRSNICSLVLFSALGTGAASAAPILPYDVTLTSWQINFTTHQETFTLTGPGISLTGTGYVTDVPSSSALFFSPRTRNSFGDSFRADNNLLGGTLAQGTVNGITYDAANPLGLYGGGPYFTISPLQVPSGTNPVGTYPVTLFGVSGTSQPWLIACTTSCVTGPETIPFGFNFLPAAGTLQAQFTGPDPFGDYTLDSFNLTASSATPEPASYASLAIGLFVLWLGARILPKLSYGKAKAT